MYIFTNVIAIPKKKNKLTTITMYFVNDLHILNKIINMHICIRFNVMEMLKII